MLAPVAGAFTVANVAANNAAVAVAAAAVAVAVCYLLLSLRNVAVAVANVAAPLLPSLSLLSLLLMLPQ